VINSAMVQDFVRALTVAGNTEYAAQARERLRRLS
jgi:hypothetical protein